MVLHTHWIRETLKAKSIDKLIKRYYNVNNLVVKIEILINAV